jgi:hypothetical protein
MTRMFAEVAITSSRRDFHKILLLLSVLRNKIGKMVPSTSISNVNVSCIIQEMTAAGCNPCYLQYATDFKITDDAENFIEQSVIIRIQERKAT